MSSAAHSQKETVQNTHPSVQVTADLEPGSISFDHQPRTRLIFGANSVERLGELARGLGARKSLLVTDSGIVAAGHAERVQRILEASGISVVLYGKARENPNTQDVDECVAVAREAGIDSIIGLGGGSSMDTAKGCNFLLTNGGRIQDYWGMGKAAKPMLPLIAIPTTAGTGSECQSFALIADEKTHQKMACGDPKAAARIAILDPVLTLSQPARVAACTGIDTIAHAVETAVTKKRNALSLMYSHEAFKLTVNSFPTVMREPKNLEARGRMLLGAALAGTAIENSMLGAIHAAANPLTAHFGVVHGQAVGIMLPLVVRFNGQDAIARKGYAELASAPEIACASDGHHEALEALIARLEGLLNLAQIPRSLADCGVDRSKIKIMAAEAANQWTATFNPRAVSEKDFVELYEAAFRPRGDGKLS
ncbi:iron-containing alcohol dehydrogenase [Pedosphaera parvula]|uniref:Iron-containing alcohol dehydrogenase n=1 Tax=Pedosphaera parvula (strain Ellin514) TaxID=320771 RepID=B9XQ53_PEDPL|nr:iron-containing alcohol dehydrogenase [Pedosphaera parvula]EEF58057.1 iron-containing alcohol dehydrogenase [Pedosphaera parvula Ellin514]